MSKKLPPIICPTPEEIPGLVTRAAVLDAEISERSAELKAIKQRLSLAALQEPAAPLHNEEREGRRVTLKGTGYSARVTISSDSLISGFRDKSEVHATLLCLLERDAEGSDMTPADLLSRFFAAPSKWETRFEDGHFTIEG